MWLIAAAWCAVEEVAGNVFTVAIIGLASSFSCGHQLPTLSIKLDWAQRSLPLGGVEDLHHCSMCQLVTVNLHRAYELMPLSLSIVVVRHS
jgi:hypothetical protein